MSEPAPSGPPRRGPPRRMQVRHIAPLSPRMARITFGGEGLAGLEWRGPAGHLKLVVPADGEHEAAMPSPDGPRPATMRTYTPRAIRSEPAEIDIDFVLHAHGPAGRWASRAAVGDRLVMLGPAPGYRPDAEASGFLLLGDDTALPALETLLEALPDAVRARSRVLIEVGAGDERRDLPGAGAAEIRWLVRPGDATTAGQALFDAATELPWPWPPGVERDGGRIYIGCESAAMRRIRTLLLERGDVDKRQIVGRGYWKLGAANHPDHDFADEPRA